MARSFASIRIIKYPILLPSHTGVLEVKGFKLGFLMRYDSCFPEMYDRYRHKDVKMIFHPFHNGHHKGKTILDEIVQNHRNIVRTK